MAKVVEKGDVLGMTSRDLDDIVRQLKHEVRSVSFSINRSDKVTKKNRQTDVKQNKDNYRHTR